jgi:hypothetical protein
MEEKNSPESGFCKAYKIDMIWEVGGGIKIKKRQNIVKNSATI